MPACATSELIVDAPRFMTFRAQNVQAAKRNHFIVFSAALLDILVVDRFPLICGDLKDFPFLLEQDHILRRVTI